MSSDNSNASFRTLYGYANSLTPKCVDVSCALRDFIDQTTTHIWPVECIPLCEVKLNCEVSSLDELLVLKT